MNDFKSVKGQVWQQPRNLISHYQVSPRWNNVRHQMYVPVKELVGEVWYHVFEFMESMERPYGEL